MQYVLQMTINDINNIVKCDIKNAWQIQYMKFIVINVDIFCKYFLGQHQSNFSTPRITDFFQLMFSTNRLWITDSYKPTTGR